jgi:Mor family transcriptional regulator
MLTVLVGILINNSRLNDMISRISDLRSHMDTRFDDMRVMWHSELHRVEEVLAARLRHLEEN